MSTFYPRDLSRSGQMEKDLGISTTEFLATICEMILRDAPLIPPMGLTSMGGPLNLIAGDWNPITLRAAVGVKSLLKRSDWALVNAFLKAYSEFNKECYSKELVLNYNGRRELKNFLFVKMEGMELPNLPEFDQTELESYICSRNGAAYSEINLSSLFTTLSPSIRSETFSSLRALKDRIETGAGECIDVLDSSLPSNMMRNASSVTSLNFFSQNLMRGDSQGLLSATSSNFMDFSALDTLASVSTYVKDSLLG